MNNSDNANTLQILVLIPANTNTLYYTYSKDRPLLFCIAFGGHHSIKWWLPLFYTAWWVPAILEGFWNSFYMSAVRPHL